MIRLLVAVTLAVTLLGVTLPAVEEARTRHADALLRGELRELRADARSLLAREDPVPPGVAGARRVVTVRLPTTGRGTAVRLGTRAGRTDALAWGSAPLHSLVTRFPLRTVVDGRLLRDGQPLRLRAPGRHRLALGLRRIGGRTVVTVRRFKPGNATTPGDARRERRLRL